jgi:lysophosphatidate acyltransferase
MSWLLYLAASPVALIMFLRLLTFILPAGPAQLVGFFAFSLTSFILLMFTASYGVFASIFLRLVGYGGCSQWTTGRLFKWSMWFVTGITFRATGSMKRENGLTGEDAMTMRPAVFVGNHQTEMDVLMLGCIFPKYCSVTAKSSLKWTPFLGWFSTYTHTLFSETFGWAGNTNPPQWPSPKPCS